MLTSKCRYRSDVYLSMTLSMEEGIEKRAQNVVIPEAADRPKAEHRHRAILCIPHRFT